MLINHAIYPEITGHALYRLRGRMAGFVSEADLIKAQAAARRSRKEEKASVLPHELSGPVRFWETPMTSAATAGGDYQAWQDSHVCGRLVAPKGLLSAGFPLRVGDYLGGVC